MNNTLVKGKISRKSRSGLQLDTQDNTWFNISRYTQEPHIFETSTIGNTVELELSGNNFIKKMTILDGLNIKINSNNSHTELTDTVTSSKTLNKNTQTQILKNVTAYAVFQSPVVAFLMTTVPPTKSLEVLISVSGIIEKYLTDPENKSLSEHLTFLHAPVIEEHKIDNLDAQEELTK